MIKKILFVFLWSSIGAITSSLFLAICYRIAEFFGRFTDNTIILIASCMMTLLVLVSVVTGVALELLDRKTKKDGGK